jgi:UDP-N-acetylmuramoylalanine--D-glutamate ligase
MVAWRVMWQPHAITVSSKNHGSHYYMQDGCMIDNELALDLSMMQSLQGAHNHQNALVAYAVLRSLGYEPSPIANAMQSFQGLPHRMERIRQWDGMLWVNDSKATNADAAWQSLSTYQNIYWIVGGALKQGGIDVLAPLAGHITHAYVIGADTAPVAASLAEMGIAHKISGDMNQAVLDAFADASGQQDAVILLAPAAASFDQYRNFEERGDHFRELVLGLT